MAGLLGATPVAFGQTAPWVEGTHYFAIQPARPTGLPASKIEVTEIFSYACPGCNRFYPIADQLAASPRPLVRLIGLSVRSWPRTGGDDPLIPNHVVPRRDLQPRSVTEIDRTNFAIIRGQARHLALSRSRRSARVCGTEAG